MPVYVVDSNFFIQAHRATYPLDVATSFWNKIMELSKAGKLISIDKVKQEIHVGEDDLKRWCIANLPKDFFKDTKTIVGEYTRVAGWANSKSQHYTPAALTEFLDVDEADAWLVAYALSDVANRVLVTHEKSDPLRRNRIKIPEACQPFNVSHVNTIEMLRQLGETF